MSSCSSHRKKKGVDAKSQWETKELAETRSRELYPRLIEIVDKFDVSFLTAETEKAEYSTSHTVAALATSELRYSL